MNYELRVPAGEARIDLAREPDFRLGGALVRPSLCRFTVGDASEQVEPRVMQVLVALARDEKVVSRDDLARLCWEGRIVTPGAINRCVAEVRRLGERANFTVETIARVGYLLKRVDSEPDAVAEPHEPAASSDSAVPSSTKSQRRTLWFVAATVVIAAIATVGAIMLWPSPKYWQVVEARPLIATPLRERHPAISHDGQMIAYSAGADGVHLNIYFRRIAGSASVRLTQEPDAEWASWSPGDERVAYVSYVPGRPCRIRITEVPAGTPREVGRCKIEERPRVAWSADGSALYFADRLANDQPAHVVRLDLRTGDYRDISRPPANIAGDNSVTASPDGRWIGFSRCTDPQTCKIAIQDVQTGDVRAFGVESGSGPAWSSDSTMMFAATADGARFAIWQIPVDGSPPRQLTANSDRLARVSAGPDGLLAAEVRRMSINLARPPATAGGDAQWIEGGSTGSATTEAPSSDNWSPAVASDGSVAVASSRSGTFGIWILKGGTLAYQIANLGASDPSFLSWAPDGTRLAFAVRTEKQNPHIEIVNKDGAYPRRIDSDARQLGPLSWSSNGDALFYSARDAQGWRLWRLNLRALTREPISDYGWQAVQADGERLYAVKEGVRGFWLYGTKPQLITTEWPRAAPFPATAAFEWRVSRGNIVFTEFTDIHRARLIGVPITGGPPRVLFEMPRMADVVSFAIDPRDGSPVYPAIASIESDIELFRLARP